MKNLSASRIVVSKISLFTALSLVAALSLVTTLSACSKSTPTQDSSAEALGTPTTKQQADQPAISTQPSSDASSEAENYLLKDKSPPINYQKPGAPIAMVGASGVTLKPSDTVLTEIVLAIGAEGKTTVLLKPDDAITLLSKTQYQFLEPGEVVIPVQVSTQTPSKAYINIFAEHIDPAGTKTTRALAFMVDSRGPQALKSQVGEPSGVISMPATEVIK